MKQALHTVINSSSFGLTQINLPKAGGNLKLTWATNFLTFEVT